MDEINLLMLHHLIIFLEVVMEMAGINQVMLHLPIIFLSGVTEMDGATH